jgi:hypothetical protein
VLEKEKSEFGPHLEIVFGGDAVDHCSAHHDLRYFSLTSPAPFE